MVGILHNVVEQVNISFEQLKKEGFAEHIVDAVRCLGRRNKWTKDSFTKRTMKPIGN